MPNRGYKLRMYPTRTQERALAQWFGHTRWVWNWGLESRQKAYARRKESLTCVDLNRRLTQLKKAPSLKWLAEVPADCLTQKLRDLDAAYAQRLRRTRACTPAALQVPARRTSACVCGFDAIDTRGRSRAWSRRHSSCSPNIGRVKLRGRRTLPADDAEARHRHARLRPGDTG